MTQRINTNLHSNSYFKVPKFSNSTNSKINLNDYEEVEDEYGFRYMRKKQRLLSSCELIYPSNAHEIGDEDNEIMSTPIPSNKMATVFVNGKTAFVSRPRINEAFPPQHRRQVNKFWKIIVKSVDPVLPLSIPVLALVPR